RRIPHDPPHTGDHSREQRMRCIPFSLPSASFENDRESRTFPLWALDANQPAVSFDDPFTDAQPQPIAFRGASWVRLIEPVENMRQMLLRNPRACIADRELRSVSRVLNLQG